VDEWKNVLVDVMPPPTDEPVAGDFTVVRELGRGSSSVVHLARQRSLGRDVALKRLLRTLSGDAAAVARLRREGQIVARLADPRIVRLYDLITDGADLILVMEYVRGPSVLSLAAASPPSPSQALAVVADVAGALEYAAKRGVVHRDVKPANVFVTAAGRCKLGDFGLARMAGERDLFMSNDGTVRGTPFYMAPEQLSGGAPAPAWDVYALALTALELLSGRHPFAGLSLRGVAEAHRDGGAASAATACSLPKPVVDVIRDGLAASGVDRPSARQLADGLLQAAPREWLSIGAKAEPAGPAASDDARTSGGPVRRDGLWAGGNHRGWTVDLVDGATWLGTANLTVEGLSRAAPAAQAHDSPPMRGAPGPSKGPMSGTRAPTIDDGWITSPAPVVRARGARRIRRAWMVTVAAFVVGFALALIAVELLL
jgi:predicted Ser/Thr protein kinase